MSVVVETQRLRLRRLTTDDAPLANLLRKIGLTSRGRMTLTGSDEQLSFFAVEF